MKKWAISIAVNTSINYNQRVIKQSNEEFDADIHVKHLSSNNFKDTTDEKLLGIIKTLPEAYFAVFNLYVIDGYSHDEIANILGISPALSRKKLSRARTWLKKTIVQSKYNSSDSYPLTLNYIS